MGRAEHDTALLEGRLRRRQHVHALVGDTKNVRPNQTVGGRAPDSRDTEAAGGDDAVMIGQPSQRGRRELVHEQSLPVMTGWEMPVLDSRDGVSASMECHLLGNAAGDTPSAANTPTRREAVAGGVGSGGLVRTGVRWPAAVPGRAPRGGRLGGRWGDGGDDEHGVDGVGDAVGGELIEDDEMGAVDRLRHRSRPSAHRRSARSPGPSRRSPPRRAGPAHVGEHEMLKRVSSARMSFHVGKAAMAWLVGASTVIPSPSSRSITGCGSGCGSTSARTSAGARVPSNRATRPASSTASANSERSLRRR